MLHNYIFFYISTDNLLVSTSLSPQNLFHTLGTMSLRVALKAEAIQTTAVAGQNTPLVIMNVERLFVFAWQQTLPAHAASLFAAVPAPAVVARFQNASSRQAFIHARTKRSTRLQTPWECTPPQPSEGTRVFVLEESVWPH